MIHLSFFYLFPITLGVAAIWKNLTQEFWYSITVLENLYICIYEGNYKELTLSMQWVAKKCGNIKIYKWPYVTWICLSSLEDSSRSKGHLARSFQILNSKGLWLFVVKASRIYSMTTLKYTVYKVTADFKICVVTTFLKQNYYKF